MMMNNNKTQKKNPKKITLTLDFSYLGEEKEQVVWEQVEHMKDKRFISHFASRVFAEKLLCEPDENIIEQIKNDDEFHKALAQNISKHLNLQSLEKDEANHQQFGRSLKSTAKSNLKKIE